MSAVLWISIGLTLLLIVGGFIYYETSGTTTTTTTKVVKDDDKKTTGVCTEKDATKCCGGSDKCKSSETACACEPGQSYDCATNKCLTNCVCGNGKPAGQDKPDAECKEYGKTTKCASCNGGYGLVNAQCLKQCGQGGDYNGTCQGVVNPGESNGHDHNSSCCKHDGKYVHCCGHGCSSSPFHICS